MPPMPRVYMMVNKNWKKKVKKKTMKYMELSSLKAL